MPAHDSDLSHPFKPRLTNFCQQQLFINGESRRSLAPSIIYYSSLAPGPGEIQYLILKQMTCFTSAHKLIIKQPSKCGPPSKSSWILKICSFSPNFQQFKVALKWQRSAKFV